MMTPTVAVLSRIPRLAHHLQIRLPQLRISDVTPGLADSSPEFEKAEILVADCDLLIPYVSKLNQLSAKWIQATWAGLDKFVPYVYKNRSAEEQKEKPKYILTRFSDESFGLAMSEYIIAQIVNYERDQRQQYENQKLAIWNQEGKLMDHRTINELTIGILGVGTIGKTVAQKLKLFGATIWGLTRTVPTEKLPYLDEHRTVDDLPDILKNCDYVINILPSTENTKGLLNGNVLKHCEGKNVVFINVGRGSVIKETDLVNALEQNWISAAILDVFETEPLPRESKLWNLPQVTISPHNSAVTVARNIVNLFATNYTRYINGETMKNVFDFDKGY